MKNSPTFCWQPRLILASLASAAVIVVLAWLGRRLEPGSPGRILMALGQGIAVAALTVLLARSIQAQDELQRRIQLHALAFAFVSTAVLGTAWGFLENAGLPRLDFGTLLWPGMTVLWAIGVGLARRRYL